MKSLPVTSDALARHVVPRDVLESISPTFYKLLFALIFLCQKLQSQSVTREKLLKTLCHVVATADQI